jgi:magnesium chelatase subunit D
VRPGKPVAGERLHLPSTLKAAAPWQRLRAASLRQRGPGAPLLAVQSSDFRIQRFKARRQTTHIFVVDASGSSAVHRLAEAKGAIELLLAQSYVRRDQVALVAFRGTGAEQLLAPTRALARARRELAGLPGGGGTPLAAGIDAAHELALDIQRKGHNPVVAVMTDGRANVARDGSHGHEQAHADALLACKRLAMGGWSGLLVDTSRRPRPRARELAEAMGAQYLPLPQASAGSLSSAVQAASAA